MAKYDLNGDLTLEYSELKLAFSHFGGMIQGVARSKDKDLDHEDLEKLFFILLNKGELPGGWTFYRWGEDDSKKVRVGYSELSTTLTTIAEIIKQGNQPKE